MFPTLSANGGADGTYAPDKSTVQFQSQCDDEGTLRNFGAHYNDVVRSAAGNFVCDIRNHTDAEMREYSYRIDRRYENYLDGVIAGYEAVPGDPVIHEEPYALTFDTAKYATQSDKTYVFKGGTITIGTTSSASLDTITPGANTVEISEPDGVYVITLQYERKDTTYIPPYVPPAPKPTPTPTPSPSVSPSPSPGETPGPSPSPSPGPTPDNPEPPPSIPPSLPDPRPDPRPPRPLAPAEQEKVDKVVDDVIKHPDVVIHDRDIFEELYQVSIDDLDVPLYWGPDFAVVELPNNEFVAIGSELVPLGALPQTGTMWSGMAVVWAGAALMVVGTAIAVSSWVLTRRKEEA